MDFIQTIEYINNNSLTYPHVIIPENSHIIFEKIKTTYLCSQVIPPEQIDIKLKEIDINGLVDFLNYNGIELKHIMPQIYNIINSKKKTFDNIHIIDSEYNHNIKPNTFNNFRSCKREYYKKKNYDSMFNRNYKQNNKYELNWRQQNNKIK
jgi:hypothetical protein